MRHPNKIRETNRGKIKEQDMYPIDQDSAQVCQLFTEPYLIFFAYFFKANSRQK
jgi:hypothetical protein